MRHALIPVLQFASPLACLLALVAGFGPLASGTNRVAGVAPAHAAQRIYVDLATGGLREPTAAELAAEAGQAANGLVPASGLQASQKQALAAGATAADGADEVHFADGTVGVRPARKYLHTVVLCRQADGRYTEQCADAGSAR